MINWLWWIWYKIKDFPREAKWFIQRGRRGWADCDVWDMNDYQIEVTIGMLEELIRQKSSYPAKVKSFNEWKRILKSILKGFYSARRMANMEFVTKNNHFRFKLYERWKKEFEKSWALMGKWHGHLWD